MEKDEYFMRIALEEAQKAYDAGEIPVGAILVYKDEIIIAKGFNLREREKNPLAHAEMIVINDGARVLDRWRLSDTVLYVTLEPCVMCAGSIVQARIDRLVYGADDPKAGAVKSLMNITGDVRLNHRVETTGGVLKEECSSLVREFFRQLRIKKQ